MFKRQYHSTGYATGTPGDLDVITGYLWSRYMSGTFIPEEIKAESQRALENDSYQYTPSWQKEIENHIEIYTNDPSSLTDEYLEGVRRRLFNGTATPQDRLYADEVFRRASRRSGFLPVDFAPPDIAYIRLENGKPYIGVTGNSWRQRYSKEKGIRTEGPIAFIPGIPDISNNAKGTQRLIHDIENALINLNGGLEGTANKEWSRYDGDLDGSIERGEKWLNKNEPEWRKRYNFRNNNDNNSN